MRYLFKDKDVFSAKGTNADGAKDSYLNKWMYDFAFPLPGVIAPTGELRANLKGIYGRVDSNGHVVLPKREHIVQMPTGEEEGRTFECLSITQECFAEASEYYENLKIRGKVAIENTSYESLVPKRTMTFARQDYNSYYQDTMNQLYQAIVNGEFSSDPIKGYEDFEKAFVSFAHSMTTQRLPFTLSEFCISSFGTPHQSGLVIDLSEEDCSEDEAKYKGFITDPNFNVVRSVFNRFGFRIDKHIPWRIYLDLNSPYVIEKLEARGMNSIKEFFHRYYDRVATEEIVDIPSKAIEAYNGLVRYSNVYREVIPCRTIGTRIVKGTRKETTLKKVEERRPESHWMRMYAFIRSVELKKQWSQNKFDKIVQEAYNIYKYRSEPRAYEFLESHFTDRTSELFIEKPLTKDKVFDNIVVKDSRKAHYKF